MVDAPNSQIPTHPRQTGTRQAAHVCRGHLASSIPGQLVRKKGTDQYESTLQGKSPAFAAEVADATEAVEVAGTTVAGSFAANLIHKRK